MTRHAVRSVGYFQNLACADNGRVARHDAIPHLLRAHCRQLGGAALPRGSLTAWPGSFTSTQEGEARLTAGWNLNPEDAAAFAAAQQMAAAEAARDAAREAAGPE